MQQTDGEPPYGLTLVTADPFEGEAMTEAGNGIVEPVMAWGWKPLLA